MRAVIVFAALVMLGLATAQAAIQPFKFDSPEQGRRFQQLSDELRCLVCQNENLTDSNADLAQDLRRQIHGMILSGKTNDEIIHYMVARYGDFVLYKPPLISTTYLLWFGPFALVAVGLFALLRFVRRQQRKRPTVLSDEERRRLDELLRFDGDAPRR
jgi:cytochrome c-type biogenesis protein CcmH